MPLNIAIGVHGRFHAFDLALGLQSRSRLLQVATTYPRSVARRFLPADIPLRTAPALEIWRRLYGRYRIGPKPDASISRRFGQFAARTLPPDMEVFVGWSSASLEAIAAAHAHGAVAVVERGSSHILHQEDVLRRVYDAHGLAFSGIEPEIVARELAEYDAADLIAVPSTFAAQTFVDRGVARDRLLVNPYGVEAGAFAADADRPRRDRPVIVFVGGVGIRKGVPELIEAFRPLSGRAELLLVGPVEAGWTPPEGENVRFAGSLDRAGVAGALRSADIFCLPSHEEGLPLSLLQAMCASLPVVASPETGASDVVTHGREGLIAGHGDAGALTDALATLIDDSERRIEMGRAAGARAVALTWSAYAERAVAGYAAARAPTRRSLD